MPMESRVGDAPSHLAAPPKPELLHGRRVPGRAQPAAAGVCRQQLPHHVPDDGARRGTVCHAPATHSDTGRRQAQPGQLAGSRRSASNTAKNLRHLRSSSNEHANYSS